MSQGVVQDARDRAAHKRFKASKPTNLVPPITYGNATMTERYVSPAWAVRDGSDRVHDSVPMGAQIEVRAS